MQAFLFLFSIFFSFISFANSTVSGGSRSCLGIFSDPSLPGQGPRRIESLTEFSQPEHLGKLGGTRIDSAYKATGPNGEVVFMKEYLAKKVSSEAFLAEANYAHLMGEAGLGPRVRGVFSNATSHILVTDFIEGKVQHIVTRYSIPDQFINSENLSRLVRLKELAELHSLNLFDLQFMVDRKGVLHIIDTNFSSTKGQAENKSYKDLEAMIDYFRSVLGHKSVSSEKDSALKALAAEITAGRQIIEGTSLEVYNRLKYLELLSEAKSLTLTDLELTALSIRALLVRDYAILKGENPEDYIYANHLHPIDWNRDTYLGVLQGFTRSKGLTLAGTEQMANLIQFATERFIQKVMNRGEKVKTPGFSSFELSDEAALQLAVGRLVRGKIDYETFGRDLRNYTNIREVEKLRFSFFDPAQQRWIQGVPWSQVSPTARIVRADTLVTSRYIEVYTNFLKADPKLVDQTTGLVNFSRADEIYNLTNGLN